MHEQSFLALIILLYVAMTLGSCRGRDAGQARNADQSELSQSSPGSRGAPGNPRGPSVQRVSRRKSLRLSVDHRRSFTQFRIA